MLRLEDTKLYKIFVSRQTNNSKYYSCFLTPLAHDLGILLEYVKKEYEEFPDHGLQHSLRIIEYIGNLLDEDQICEITDMELFIFILSALFHDTGMTLYNSEDKERVRSQHHCYAEKVIKLYFDDCMKTMNHKDRIKEVVIFSCYAHGLMLNDLTSENRFSRKDKISYDKVRYNLLAYLLRIGDLMDLEGERVNNFRMLMYSEFFSELALEHNRRHQNVRLFDFSSEEIVIEVEAENILQYKIWHEWFGYLKDDILSANTVLKETKITFPFPTTSIIASNGEKFDIQELRFEIDEKGGIWDIISKSIYTNELDFVRELVQNAIDATLKRVYIDKKIRLDAVSPRSWQIYDEKFIAVFCSEKRRKLYVIDQGIGMDKEDLQNFLFKVSSSGRVDCSNRKFVFPGIAQYGIGFVSCLINADKIQVYTSKEKDPNIYHVTMESVLNVAFIQKITNSLEFTGTIIELDLKHSFSNKDIKSYLSNTFNYTSVKIEYTNLDIVEMVASNMLCEVGCEEALEKPFLLLDFVLRLKKDTDEKSNPILKDKEKIIQYEKQVKELNKFLQEHYFKKSWKTKLANYNSKVEQLKDVAPSAVLSRNFPDIKLDMKKKINDEETLSKISSNMADYEFEIMSEKAKCDGQIARVRFDVEMISLKNISIGEEWRYLVVFFDSQFEIKDIRYSLKPIVISGETGIILFKHSGQDFQRGIEFVAINGFFFSNGKIYNKLARFSGYSELKKPFVTPQSFVVGLRGDADDVREEVQEYYEGILYEEHTSADYHSVSYDFETHLEAEYDVIHIWGNNFVRSNNQNVFKVKGLFNEGYDDTIDLYQDIVEMNKKEKNHNIELGLIELDRCIIRGNHCFYQDGIAISSNIDSLFPAGLFRIVCNCTADARMRLNVTRHETSKIRTDIERWMEQTGARIQEMVLDSLLDMLEEENLYIEFEEVMSQDDRTDYFSKLSYKNIRSILRRRDLR